MYRPIRPLLLLTVSTALSILLSACQSHTNEQIEDSTADYCHQYKNPFAHSVCRIDSSTLDAEGHDLQLFWQQNDRPRPLLTFDALTSSLPASTQLTFATNAGMYDQDYAPIGYTVINGQEIKSLNLNQGGGNFHLLPNGALWWDKAGNMHITESQALSKLLASGEAQPYFATQSGPMLVIDGEIHPKFNPDSTSKKIRNGVGVCDDGSLQLVISDVPVTFYAFASLFKDDLQCPNALFLDGGIASAMYAPDIQRHDKKQMGVMIGVVHNLSEDQ